MVVFGKTKCTQKRQKLNFKKLCNNGTGTLHGCTANDLLTEPSVSTVVIYRTGGGSQVTFKR
jgi:hypothetical protein